MNRRRLALRLTLVAAGVAALLSLTQCGVPLFSPDAVLAAHLINKLDYDGQGVTQIPDNANNFDPATLRFIPSIVKPIATWGPDGFVVGSDSYGVGILVSCPNPYDTNPATSGIRLLPNSNDSFGFADNDPLHLRWLFDTVNVVSGYDDYYLRIIFNYSSSSVATWAATYPTQSSTLATTQVYAPPAPSTLDSIFQTGFPSSVVVGGSIGVEPTGGNSNIYVMLRNSAGRYVPVLCTIAQTDGSLTTGSQIGGGEVPFAIASGPTNGAYFYDPTSGQEYFSYEDGGTIKTLSWTANIPGIAEIAVHDLPAAILPGGNLYVETDGEAQVYKPDGSLVGKVSTGGLHFIHMRWISSSEQKMVFTYTFAAPYNGAKGVYTRTYSTSVSAFLSLLN